MARSSSSEKVPVTCITGQGWFIHVSDQRCFRIVKISASSVFRKEPTARNKPARGNALETCPR